MAAEDGTAGGLESFAGANGLTFASSASLPSEGALLSQGGDVEGAVTGTLPGGLGGTLARYHYTTTSTDSDGHSRDAPSPVHDPRLPSAGEHRLRALPRLPGARQLDGRRHGQGLKQVKTVEDAVKDGKAYAFDGTNDAWLTSSSRPRSWIGSAAAPKGSGSSSPAGCSASPATNSSTKRELTGLCNDAAHVAEAVRKESLEEVDSGRRGAPGANRMSPTQRSRRRPRGRRRGRAGPPRRDNRRFRGHLFASPGRTARRCCGLSWSRRILNVFLLAITINLVVANQYTGLVIASRRW